LQTQLLLAGRLFARGLNALINGFRDKTA